MYLGNSNSLCQFQPRQQFLLRCLRNRVCSVPQPFVLFNPGFRYVAAQPRIRTSNSVCFATLSFAELVLQDPLVQQKFQVENFYQTLNQEQHDAVKAAIGPVCVTAGPGSGKTRVLIGRIAYLINDRRVDCTKIGAFTFTKKASKEMKERLKELIVSRDLKNLFVDENDQLHLIKEIMSSMDMKRDSSQAKKYIQKYSGIRNACQSTDEIDLSDEKDQQFVRIIKQYEIKKEINNEVDYDDLLFRVIDLFEENDNFRLYWQQKFEHILVDEFQDTNGPQMQILKLLTLKKYDNRSVFVVGDRNQSIYAFRGSHPLIFDDFFNLYQGVQKFDLIGNYRSHKFVIDASYKLNNLSQNTIPGDFTQVCRRNDSLDKKVVKRRCSSLQEEADYIAKYVKKQLSYGVKPSDITVLYRVHKYGDRIAKTLRMEQVMVHQHAAFDLWQRKEVKFFRHVLQLLLNYRSSAHDHVYKDVAHGLGDKTYKKFRDVQEQYGLTVNELILGDIHDFVLPQNLAIQTFQQVIEFSTLCTQNQQQNLKPSVVQNGEFSADLNGYENLGSQMNLQTQIQLDNNYENQNQQANFGLEPVRQSGQISENFELQDSKIIIDSKKQGNQFEPESGGNNHNSNLENNSTSNHQQNIDFENSASTQNPESINSQQYYQNDQNSQIQEEEEQQKVQNLYWEGLVEIVLEQIPEFESPEGVKINKVQIRGINKLRSFYVILKNLLQFCDMESLQYIILYVFERIGYFKETKDSSRTEKRDHLSQALKILSFLLQIQSENEEQSQSNLKRDIYEVLELIEDQINEQLDSQHRNQNCVNLMTIHASKGLEFDTVVICGLTEGLFPKQKYGEEFMEEIRLMYVAITRAKNDLLLTCGLGEKEVFQQNPSKKAGPRQPSVFHTLKYD